jgi:hypothetical protein
MKETLELIAALEILAVSGIQISKDGISAADLPKVLELLKKFDVIADGVKNLHAIPAEIKDIDQAELIQVGSAVFQAVKNIKAAAEAQVIA